MRTIQRLLQNDTISTVSCEFNSPELEEYFRRAKFDVWTKRLQFGSILGLFIYALLGISDFISLGNSPEFQQVLLARAIMVISGGGLLIFASRTKTPTKADNYVFIASIVFVLVQSFIIDVKQMGTIYHALTVQVTVLHFYFFVSNRFIYKVLTGLIISISYVILANSSFHPTIHENISLILFVFLCSNLIGAVNTYREQKLERIEFVDSLRIQEEITVRNEVEAALKESEERYALAMRASADHIYTWEVAEDKLTIALFKGNAFGIRDKPVTPAEWIARIHPDDVDEFRSQMVDHVKGKTETFHFEYRLRDDMDKYHHVRQQAIGKRDENGRVTWMAGAAIDITEQKVAREQVRKSEELYRAIFRHAGAGITLSDRFGRIFQCNETWSEMMGTSHKNCRNRNNCPTIEKITHPDDLTALREQLEALTSGKSENCQLENRFVRNDGSVWWGDLSLSPIHEADGSIQSFVGIAHDITDRKEYEEQLRVFATIDGLTGADNRRSFMEKCATELHRAKRYQRPFSLLMLDLDHFKQINDTHGHAAGDEALKAVSKFCKTTLRDEDSFGRLGGEEFAIILPEIDTVSAREAADRIREGISNLTIQSEELEFKLTASIGVSSSLAEGDTPDALLKRADKALYAAKSSGRNCVEAA